jgi:hypothetical protein
LQAIFFTSIDTLHEVTSFNYMCKPNHSYLKVALSFHKLVQSIFSNLKASTVYRELNKVWQIVDNWFLALNALAVCNEAMNHTVLKKAESVFMYRNSI